MKLSSLIEQIKMKAKNLGKKVVLLDADIGLRNLDLILGLENRIIYDLVKVAEGKCQMKQALVKGRHSENLYLLPAAQTRDKDAISPEQMKEICNEQSAKQRLSQATKDTIYINKDGVTKRIKPDELQDYLFLNWNLGIGYDISIETKSKIGEKSKNLVWIYNDKLKKCKRFKNNVVDEFLENNLDWKKGFRKW